MSIKIERATKEDVPELLGLIVELAVYEKEPDAVVATPELMIKNVFENNYAEVLIARTTPEDGSKGVAVGLALYFFTFSTWLGAPGLYLEDLYVKPEYRAQGLGKRFFGELGHIAQERGCKRVEWRVLKWNKPSIDFYKECLKAESQDEWDTMRIEGQEGFDRLMSFRKN
ncbi:acetyltransferase [Kwoniella mangroviensis CBS 10435]|uniref:Acetyltransferase n=1 Tax=Kwoniella mangroviensis CBS 10435 TaxID=1331196 RepID=A0A1B9ILU8_9TREE|nr:acetyltransferase [Kwoniella mangroviensis CBS 8507]OCF56589.1 acetyltransferase [Kwoniella mangroviensis CBS 10435]OCF65323.1 acetyltransferase [Kwoniella mangroviensis CBS 8507]OCF75160.1 acetyltransferase [Kwoniella mangroviensis CBS 8886]